MAPTDFTSVSHSTQSWNPGAVPTPVHRSGGNDIDNSGAALLAAGLKVNQGLQTLYLSEC